MNLNVGWGITENIVNGRILRAIINILLKYSLTRYFVRTQEETVIITCESL